MLQPDKSHGIWSCLRVYFVYPNEKIQNLVINVSSYMWLAVHIIIAN